MLTRWGWSVFKTQESAVAWHQQLQEQSSRLIISFGVILYAMSCMISYTYDIVCIMISYTISYVLWYRIRYRMSISHAISYTISYTISYVFPVIWLPVNRWERASSGGLCLSIRSQILALYFGACTPYLVGAFATEKRMQHNCPGKPWPMIQIHQRRPCICQGDGRACLPFDSPNANRPTDASDKGLRAAARCLHRGLPSYRSVLQVVHHFI